MERTLSTRARRGGYWWGIVTLAFLVAVATLMIVNIAVSGRMDWAYIPLAAIGLAWCVLSALAFGGRVRLIAALGTLSLLVIPFLRTIQAQTGGNWVQPVATPIVIASLVLLWLGLVLFRYTHWRRMACSGIMTLGVLGLLVVIDRTLSAYLGMPVDVLSFWNIVSLTGIAAVQFLVAIKVRRA